LWNDDGGALIATEWLFLVTITVIGLVTGLVAVRNAVVEELAEVGNAITSLDQSYSFDGLHGCGAFTAGTHVTDKASRNTVSKVSGGDPHSIDVNICESF
jgi:hypothetical protein